MEQIQPVTVAAFYKFLHIGNVAERVVALRGECDRLALRGTILLASEGINATIAGDGGAVATLLEILREDPGIGTLDVKLSMAPTNPFQRMKVKERREIITLGDRDGDPEK
jgi:UPF0176 protein